MYVVTHSHFLRECNSGSKYNIFLNYWTKRKIKCANIRRTKLSQLITVVTFFCGYVMFISPIAYKKGLVINLIIYLLSRLVFSRDIIRRIYIHIFFPRIRNYRINPCTSKSCYSRQSEWKPIGVLSKKSASVFPSAYEEIDKVWVI